MRSFMMVLLMSLAAGLFVGDSAQAQTIPGGEQEPGDPPAADTVHYAYLVPWEWRETQESTAGRDTITVDAPHWAVKYGEPVGVLDMRSAPQKGCNPALRSCPANGWAIALYDEIQPGQIDLRFLSTWQQNRSGAVQPINADDASFLLCGLPERLPGSETLGGFVRGIFAECGDPTGLVRFRPLLPNEHRVVKANLGPVRIFQGRVARSSQEYTKAVQALRFDYDRIVQDQGLDIALKRAGFWLEKYGEDIRSQSQIARDGAPVTPATTQTDDFDCSDSDTFGCDLTWTEVTADWDIASNLGTKTANSDGYARAEASVSGDDHFAEVTCDSLPDFNWCGVAVRFDSSAATMYYYSRRNDNTSHQIYSVTTGTATLISGSCGGDYLGGTSTITIKLEIDGSDLEASEGGVSKCSVTDSGITGNDLCGLYGYHASPGYDDFTCEDVGGGGGAARRIFVVSDE